MRPESDWLFKPAVFQSNGVRQLGDWTEMACSRIANELDIPSATSRLAVRHGTEGVVVRNVRPVDYDMHTGRVAMLHEIDVQTRDSKRDRTASIGHTLENVLRVLDAYGPPPGWQSWEEATAIDVFVAYLILDALVGNGDRHEQNWSVLWAKSSVSGLTDRISPSYDIEASLGFQLSDRQRSDRLRDATAMRVFAERGLARRFDGDQKTSLVDIALRASRCCSEPGKKRLAELVGAVGSLAFIDVVDSFDGVSDVARRFACEILKINGGRINDVNWDW
jgi:hypothetical protein